ncbi:MAG: helix-turn-helix domain-containing protein [Elusimicrobia bacterium]|nr:helix-turn-helix domain-containing protein [Candidatus Liberimonas magnetica]
MIGTNATSIWEWEINLHSPVISFVPKIVKFLGYIPYSKDFSEYKDKLIYFRRLSGLSQEKLAALLQVDESTVASWERGEHKPTKKLLNKVEKLLFQPFD